ncbi:hypothetical protein ACJJTC_005771, partial [Scirpophaga incertulas]
VTQERLMLSAGPFNARLLANLCLPQSTESLLSLRAPRSKWQIKSLSIAANRAPSAADYRQPKVTKLELYPREFARGNFITESSETVRLVKQKFRESRTAIGRTREGLAGIHYSRYAPRPAQDVFVLCLFIPRVSFESVSH